MSGEQQGSLHMLYMTWRRTRMAPQMSRSVFRSRAAFVGPQNNAFCKHTGLEPIECSCGEEEKEFAWAWSTREQGGQAGSILLSSEDRQIIFNPEYSSGTAAIRGNKPLLPGVHHYWELKMTSAVYGTDIMVGVCTPKCDLQYGIHRFCSLLGRDEESWGFSYTGIVRHAAKFQPYGSRWGKGSIVGIHLDSWLGTLEFFLNRKPLGIAFTGLQNKELYPIVTSTSAHSGMKLITSCSFPATLQLQSLGVVFKHFCNKMKMHPQDVPLPPGLRSFVENNYWPFLLSVGQDHGLKNKNVEHKCSHSGTKHSHEDDPREGTVPKRFRRQKILCTSNLASSSDTCSDRSSSPGRNCSLTPSDIRSSSITNNCCTGSNIRLPPSPNYCFTGADVNSPSSPNYCFSEICDLNYSRESQSNPSPAFTTLSSSESTSSASPSAQHPAPSSPTLPKTSDTSSKPSSSQD